MTALQLGLAPLGDGLAHPATWAERQRAVVGEAVLAESLGFDSVWLAEQPAATVLAAIAARTSRVRVGGGVDLAADLDPVRIAEDYATADAIAGGRVELVAGCGASDTEERRERLREHVGLLRRLWSETGVTWSGRFRAPLDAVTLEPRPVQRPHPPIWIGGASPQHAADLAAELGLPLMLPIRRPPVRELAAIVARYRSRFTAAGRDPAQARVGCSDAVHVAPTSQEARARWRPDPLVGDAAICGSPAEVADRIAAARAALGLDLQVARFDAGGLGPAQVARAVELFAAAVAPQLRG